MLLQLVGGGGGGRREGREMVELPGTAAAYGVRRDATATAVDGLGWNGETALCGANSCFKM